MLAVRVHLGWGNKVKVIRSKVKVIQVLVRKHFFALNSSTLAFIEFVMCMRVTYKSLDMLQRMAAHCLLPAGHDSRLRTANKES